MTVYTVNGCHICDNVKVWLGSNGYDFTVVNEYEEVVKVGEENGLSNLPIVEYNGKFFSGREIIDELKSKGE